MNRNDRKWCKEADSTDGEEEGEKTVGHDSRTKDVLKRDHSLHSHIGPNIPKLQGFTFVLS